MTDQSIFPTSDYEAIKQDIDCRYPHGRFVAVESGVCIEDAASHRELVGKLAAIGKSPKGLLIVQAGVEYPTETTIFI